MPVENRREPIVNRFFRRSAVLLSTTLLLLAVGAQVANAWWDAKWQGRIKVGLNTAATGADIKEPLSELPVLVRLHSGNFDFNAAKPDGSDIRFVNADDKVPLKHHVEKYDPKQGIALLWVRVPQVAGGSGQNAVWMYFGNSSVQDAQDSGGTYDTPQALAFHFAGKDGNPRDATAYGNHAAEFRGKAGVPSVVGDGVAFDGKGALTVKAAPSLSFAKGFSASAWVRIDEPQKDAWLLSREEGGNGVVVGIRGTKPYVRVAAGGKTVETRPAGEIPPKGWHHLAVAAEGGRKITVYVDGREVSSVPAPAALPDPTSDVMIADAAKGGHPFAGGLDELEISTVARPAAWFAAAFAGQGQEGKLTALQAAETGKGGEGSTTIHLMKVVVRTITLDGWLIIGVLAVMGAWATYIFLTKFQYLKRTVGGNAEFIAKMHATTHPLDMEVAEDEFADSSIYRVYIAGCEELAVWHSAKEDRGDAGRMPKKVVEAIQAALNKASIHESRRLGAGLNIMTLGVSGGPFLGLLGTVWGVINTFAGLAEAGEANLSAIAPGVASALACTLAGLLVAIPSLFAYSDLTARIKDITADTYLFIDEFLVKIQPDDEN